MIERSASTQSTYKKLLSPLALGLFVIVAAIMIAIAMVQRTRQESVAPTAPTSQPQAAEINSNLCSVQFVVPNPLMSCEADVYADELSNTPGNYTLSRIVSEVRAGDVVVFNKRVTNTGTQTLTVNLRNIFPLTTQPYTTILDSNCSETALNENGYSYNCRNILVAAGETKNISVRMRFTQNIPIPTIVSITGEAYNDDSQTDFCHDSVTVVASSGQLTCNQACETDKECVAGLSCVNTSGANYACRDLQNPTDVTCGENTTGSADLSIAKTVSDQSPDLNQVIAYTLTARNNGPDTAGAVQVTDVLPAGLEFVSVSSTAATYNATNRTITWTIGALAANQTSTLTLSVRVLSLDRIENTATITDTSGDTTDGNPSNNTNDPDDSVLNAGGHADLGITKTVSDNTPAVGENVIYTVRVRNHGPNNTTNVEVTDDLPDGVTYQTHTVSKGEFVPATGVWDVGSLTVNEEATMTITVRVNVLTAQVNTATATGSDLPDGNPSNNTNNPGESTLNAGGSADLSLTKTASNRSPRIGDIISYIVTVTNAGPNIATGVQVTDRLPAGVTLQTHTAVPGTYTVATGIWDIGTIAVNQTVTLTLNVRVDTLAPIENRASITRSDLPDPNSSNNQNNPSTSSLNSGANVCNQACTSNANCGSNYICYTDGGNNVCRLATNPSNSSCAAGSTAATSTPTATATRQAPLLPRAGFSNNRSFLILGIILAVVILGAIGIVLLL